MVSKNEKINLFSYFKDQKSLFIMIILIVIGIILLLIPSSKSSNQTSKNDEMRMADYSKNLEKKITNSLKTYTTDDGMEETYEKLKFISKKIQELDKKEN